MTMSEAWALISHLAAIRNSGSVADNHRSPSPFSKGSAPSDSNINYNSTATNENENRSSNQCNSSNLSDAEGSTTAVTTTTILTESSKILTTDEASPKDARDDTCSASLQGSCEIHEEKKDVEKKDVENAGSAAPEADEDDDQLMTYSDDDSLSADAYFYPQSSDDDLAHPPRYRREQQRQRQQLMREQQQHDDDDLSQDPLYSYSSAPNYPWSSYYGSIHQQQGSSPMERDGSLLLTEGSPFQNAFFWWNSSNHSSSSSVTGTPTGRSPHVNGNLSPAAADGSALLSSSTSPTQNQDLNGFLLPPLLGKSPVEFDDDILAREDQRLLLRNSTNLKSVPPPALPFLVPPLDRVVRPSGSATNSPASSLYSYQQQQQQSSRAWNRSSSGPPPPPLGLGQLLLVNNDPRTTIQGDIATAATTTTSADVIGSNSNIHQVAMTKRERRRRRQLVQQMDRQAARERAVQRIRGQVQFENGIGGPKAWKDATFALLFWIQLVLVFQCAIVFGGRVLWRSEAAAASAMGDLSFWSRRHHEQGRRQLINIVVQVSNITVVVSSNNSIINVTNHTEPQVLEHLGIVPANTTDSSTSAVNETTTVKVISTSSKSSTTAVATSGSIIESTADFITLDSKNVILLASIVGFYACVLTYLSFGFMLILARALIQIMLVFSVILALVWGLLGLTLDPYGVISMMGFTALFLTLGYTINNWNRIPFAATNLYVALAAMRCTADITILGLASMLIAFGWCIVWTMALIGIVDSVDSFECDVSMKVCTPYIAFQHIPIYVVLVLSLHWTNTVIKNVVRVVVASTIGTWWYHPQDVAPFCSSVVARALLRAMTVSFGSICLGSLILQPGQALRGLAKFCCCICGSLEQNRNGSQEDEWLTSARSGVGQGVENVGRFKAESKKAASATTGSEGGTALSVPTGMGNQTNDNEETTAVSIRQCWRLRHFAEQFRVWLRSCNRWSFTYIGMYGYGFVEAGERALQLFETREWLDVVKESLIQKVMLMASLMIGGSTGTFAVVAEETDGYGFTIFHQPLVTAFLIGSMIGYVLSNILLLGVVASAYNTVMVCFAAGARELENNHPRLSREMRVTWTQLVWEPQVVH